MLEENGRSKHINRCKCNHCLAGTHDTYQAVNHEARDHTRYLQWQHCMSSMGLIGHVYTQLTLMSLTKAGVQVFSASVYSFCMSSSFGLMVTEWLPSFGSGASLYLQPSFPSLSVKSSCNCHTGVQLHSCSVCALVSKCTFLEYLLTWHCLLVSWSVSKMGVSAESVSFLSHKYRMMANS